MWIAKKIRVKDLEGKEKVNNLENLNSSKQNCDKVIEDLNLSVKNRYGNILRQRSFVSLR